MTMPRVVYGVVAGGGSVITNVGFSVSRFKKGIYDITFDQPFTEIPSVTTTEVWPDNTEDTSPNTRDNTLLLYVRSTGCRVKVGNPSGDAEDRSFCITAVGV